jgi:hypothetical protein
VRCSLTLTSPRVYDSSQGSSLSYTKQDKLNELFDPQTRFLLVTTRSRSAKPASPPEQLLAFASFRFDVEDTVDSMEYEDEPMVDVLYMWVSAARVDNASGKRD